MVWVWGSVLRRPCPKGVVTALAALYKFIGLKMNP